MTLTTDDITTVKKAQQQVQKSINQQIYLLDTIEIHSMLCNILSEHNFKNLSLYKFNSSNEILTHLKLQPNSEYTYGERAIFVSNKGRHVVYLYIFHRLNDKNNKVQYMIIVDSNVVTALQNKVYTANESNIEVTFKHALKQIDDIAEGN